VSSFSDPHRMYLFDMKNGRKKLVYGRSPEEALEILAYRLPPEEMDQILRDRYVRVNQRQLQEYVHLLG
jgi:hypothetical protein